MMLAGARGILTVLLTAVLFVVGGQADRHPSAGLHDLLSSQRAARAYDPGHIRFAYGFTSMYNQGVDGTGVTIALIELDKYVASDMHRFDVTYGLSDPRVTEYFAGGTSFTPQHEAETNFDAEWLHALAPGAAIQVYYIDGQASLTGTWQSMAQAIRMAVGNGASIVSISLSACRPGIGLDVTRAALAEVTAEGVSVFASSGDAGDRPGPKIACGNKIGVAYPSGDPSVVSIGGTSLHLKGDGTISREVAWKLSGGGRFKKLPRAQWHVAPNMPSDPYRWVPDAAFVGDPHTGVNFVDSGTWQVAAGTSLGAPAWAAAWSLVLQEARRAGKVPDTAQRAIYAIGNSSGYASVFHDIVKGSNGHYHAGVGWDPVTGWGTPDVSTLAAAVVALSSSR